MAQSSYVLLEDRGFIVVGGDDARSFLQGLISNDVDKVTSAHAIHAAFLTPQGKYLHDFFVVDVENSLIIDCEGARLDDLLRGFACTSCAPKSLSMTSPPIISPSP